MMKDIILATVSSVLFLVIIIAVNYYYSYDEYKTKYENEVETTTELTEQIKEVTLNKSLLEIKSNAVISELEEKVSELETENIKTQESLPVEPKEIECIIENEYSSIPISDEEYDLLLWCVTLEAVGEPDVGQRAVVEVVLNRYLFGWGKTIKEILLQKNQFDGMNYIDKPYATPTDKEKNNLDFVLSIGRTVLPEDYVFFATYKANGKDFIQIQNHYFGR